MQKSQVQTKITNESRESGQASVELASETSEGLTDVEIVAKKLEHITDLLTESRISYSPISSPSTLALSREVSDISVMNSSQETTASNILSWRSNPWAVSQNARQANITSEHPLLQFKDNQVRSSVHTLCLSDVSVQFQFLIAIIFTQRTNKQHLACQRASECLAVYPTPEALANALPRALVKYFSGLGLQNVKPPQLIKLAQAYVKDPPEQGRLRSKVNCPRSEISHLPQIGSLSVNSWLVYCCERIDVVTQDKTLLEYMEYLKLEAGAICL
jgi:endonuclease III